MNIEVLKGLIQENKIKWSVHCLERMAERDISRADVKKCICNGEIIEDYPEDFPHPSCLVFGYTVDNKILHVVVGTDGRELFIITTYFPKSDKFELDMKTRRVK